MKRKITLLIVIGIVLVIGLLHSCRKDGTDLGTKELADPNEAMSKEQTSQGTSYTLVLNDQTQFNTFYATYLSDATGKSIFASMFNGYVSATNTASANEDGFLKMINVLHMGVSVLKANADHSDWNKISWDNASATKATSDCGN